LEGQVYNVVMRDNEKLLTDGLLAGYAGKTALEKVVRGGFPLDASHFSGSNGTYYDEWIANMTGGGQEIVEIGESRFTRVYAGGTIGLDELQKLGITKKDVTGYLKQKLQELAEKTRLYDECHSNADGEWKYDYRIVLRNEEIPLTVSEEQITHRDIVVFVHVFLLCPVS